MKIKLKSSSAHKTFTINSGDVFNKFGWTEVDKDNMFVQDFIRIRKNHDIEIDYDETIVKVEQPKVEQPKSIPKPVIKPKGEVSEVVISIDEDDIEESKVE